MNWLRLSMRAHRRCVWTATIAAGLALGSTGVIAQQSSALYAGDPNVTVDLSVLDDGGKSVGGFHAAAPSYRGARGLLIPGAAMPVSRLLVQPPSGARSTSFGAQETETVTITSVPVTQVLPAPAPKPALVQTPKPKPQTKVATAPSKPIAPKPTPKPAVAPKPAAAVAVVAKPVKPAPKPAAKPKLKTAAKPAAPKPAPVKPTQTAALAPPPPPPPSVSTPKPPKMAALTPQKAKPAKPKTSTSGTSVKEGDVVSLIFPDGATKMPANEAKKLTNLVGEMKDRTDLRLRLFAYAGGDSLSKSKARRLSLSRALDVRSYLMKNSIRSTRIDVRALGSKTDKTPVNRVDISIVKR